MRTISNLTPGSVRTGFFRRTSWLGKAAVLLFLLVTFLPNESKATHFRYGNISWTWNNGKTVTFHVTQSWRRTYFPGPPNLGSVISATSMDFGDGQSAAINLTVTAVNTTEDWVYGEATMTHTYANNGTFTASFTSCCRISTLQNNHDQTFLVESIVDIGNGNSSPVSSMPPIINVAVNQMDHFQLAASDPDGNVLSYRLATPAEMGAGCVQPNNISINPVTGIVTYNTSGTTVNQLYNASFVVSDGHASIWVDVLLKIVAQSTPPQFDYSITPANNTHYDVQPGQTVSFSVKALDITPSDPVTLQALGLPAGASIVPALPLTGNPVTTSFNWTPTVANLGSRVVNFVAQDQNGIQTSTSVTITVSLNPVFNVPPTPAAGSLICVTPGVLYSTLVQANSPDPAQTVQIISATVPAGATFSPALPSPSANVTSTTLNWTPVSAQFGIQAISFVAKDALGHSTTLSYNTIVNSPPSFTSSVPATTISVNQPFTYSITATDAELAYGDVLALQGITLPSWMTFTQTGPTTATLTGTPGPGDIGTNHVRIDIEDTYHHCANQVSQAFDIQVSPCTFTEKISAAPSAAAYCPGTPVVLTASTADSYSWSTGATTQSVTVTAGAVASYTVTGISGFCPATNSISINGVDAQAPVAVCKNITIHLDATGHATLASMPAAFYNYSCDLPTSAFSNVSQSFVATQSGYITTIGAGIGLFGTSVSYGTVINSSSNHQDYGTLAYSGRCCYNPCAAGNNMAFVTLPSPFFVNAGETVTISFTGTSGDLHSNGSQMRLYVTGVSGAAQSIDGGSTDNCGIANYAVSQSAFDCSNVGPNNVTLTVTDASGNSSSCTAIVTVLDSIAPTVVCQNVTVNLDASGNASVTAAQVNNGSTDNCSIASVSIDKTNFNCSNVGPNPVTLTVTDVNGNVATCTSTVTVQDNIAPTAVCQNVTVSLDANGNASVTAAQVNNGSSDNCGIASLSLDQSNFTCSNVGQNPVVLKVADANGNTSTCQSIVTVVDNIAPTVVCQNVTVNLDASGNTSVKAAQVNNGSFDNCGIASVSIDKSSFTCSNVGANTVTLTVSDVNGNVSTCTSVVTVVDNIAPTAVCQNATIYLDATGNATLTAAQVNNGSSDNCGIASVSIDKSSFTCSNVGPNAVTLEVTDVNGNSSTCQAVVNVVDNIAPTAICQNVTVSLDANGNASVTAAQINNGSFDNCGIASVSIDKSSFTCSNVGANTVTLTVSDVNGNVSTCTSVVTVVDNIAPTAVCQNVTVSLDANGNASVTAAQVNNGSFDNCGIASVSIDKSSFTCSNVGPNAVTLKVTDVNGNSSTCQAVVNVVDNIAPTAVCQNVIVNLDAHGAASVTATQVNNGSFDNCGIASVSIDKSSFTCSNVGPNTVTLTVTDVNGNSSTCQSVVTVVDNIAPTAICQNVIVNLDAHGAASVTAAQVNNGSFDNCGIASVSIDKSSFTCSNVGPNTVTLTVTDVNGNVSTCQAVVNVVDNIAPTAICQNVIVNLDAHGAASVTAAQVNNGSFDNCGIASVSIDKSSFTCSNVGPNTVTLTVSDVNGNVSTCTSVVTVVDNIAPTAVCQNATIYLDATGNATLTAAQVNNGSSDNCGIASVSVSPNAFTCANTGNNVVTLTVKDVNGNVSTCTSTVTVLDKIAPVAICKNVTVNLDASGHASVTAAQVNNGSTDNCGIASVTVSPSTFTCSNAGANTVTLTVTDLSGNVSTCTSTVTVVDNIAPVAVCKSVTLALDANGNATLTAAQVDNGSSDNCSIVSRTVTPSTFTCSNFGANIVTLVVKDAAGNSSSCTSTVTIIDNLAPVANCKNVTVYLDATGKASVTAAQVNNGSTDNCGIASVTLAPAAFSCANVGANTVKLTVTDIHGNVSTCTTTVTVLDKIAPTAICKPATVTLVNGHAAVTTAMINNGSFDNCSIATMTVSPAAVSCADIGRKLITLTVTDASGNVSTCQSTLTVVGVVPTCAISSIACENDGECEAEGNDGDKDADDKNVTQMYLGYGPQMLLLNAAATGGAPYTYSWTGTGLSCTTCQHPKFKPTAGGIYVFTVVITNAYGCTSTCSISICVIDVRVAGQCNKVYLCHVPNGNPGASQSLMVNVNAVEEHLEHHPGDHLGKCSQTCGSGKEAENELIVDELDPLRAITYPNPFVDAFHLHIESSSTETISVKLYSIAGTLIQVIDHVQPDQDITVGQEVAVGMYFLEVQQGANKKVLKVKRMK